MKLMGGLGNQMFQYSLGRKLSLINNDILKLDISDYHNDIHKIKREYKLKYFNIIENIATSDEIQKLKSIYFSKNKIFSKTLNKIKNKLNIRPKTYIKEKFTNMFDPEIFNLKGNVYLEGYWQNEKYFYDIRDVLLKEFTLKYEPSKRFYELLTQIQATQAVAMHIRGGDYVRDRETANFHGVLPINYYIKAIEIIKSKLNDPFFYIFSDDLEYANVILEKLRIKCYLVSQFKLPDYEELVLMSKFKCFIIANSSFSWWGAWLSNFPDKIVIAPRIWFNNKKMRNINIAPESWIKI
jgi:hypothetical protein